MKAPAAKALLEPSWCLKDEAGQGGALSQLLDGIGIVCNFCLGDRKQFGAGFNSPHVRTGHRETGEEFIVLDVGMTGLAVL